MKANNEKCVAKDDAEIRMDGKSADSSVIYFSRAGNTDFSEDIDAITSASLQISDRGIKGNAQVIAE